MSRANDTKTAWLFPGHGSQYVGMGKTLLRETKRGRAWLALAESISGLPLGTVMERGPTSELARPSILEPLLAVISGAYVDWLRESEIRPAAVAGYSAGEVAAMYAAGVFDAETCIRAACLRGRELEQAAVATPGGMMAVFGLPASDLVALIESVGASEFVDIAAYNGPRHLSVAGTAVGLARIAVRARALGAQISILSVAGPWHTHYIRPAADRLKRELAALPFKPPSMPVWLGSEGVANSDSRNLRRSLADSIALPVRWHALVTGLICDNVKAFLEVGPGHSLCGLFSQMSLPSAIQYHFIERPGMTRLRYPASVLN